MGLFDVAIKGIIKGARVLGEEGMEGSLISGVPNYIKSFYGPSPAAKEAGTSAMVIEKALGVGSTLNEGIKNAVKMQMPYNRAVYKDTGVNRPLYQSALQTPETKTARQELIARAQANRHISEQSGRKGDNALDEVMERSAHSDYIPMTEGFYSNRAGKFIKGMKPGENPEKAVSKKELDKIEEYVTDVWKVDYSADNKAIIKRPQSWESGNHWNDMINQSVYVQIAKQVFGKDMPNPKNVDDLYNKLSQVTWKTTDKMGAKQEKIGLPKLEKDKDGVWFSFSKAGSAITEGGVNFRLKLKPNGKGLGVMSDEHNFLEFVPGVSEALPNRVLAITPPMKLNIRQNKPMQSSPTKKKVGRPPKKVKSVAYPNKSWDSFGPEGNQSLYGYTQGIKPSAKTLREQRMKAAGKAGLLSGTGGYLYSDE